MGIFVFATLLNIALNYRSAASAQNSGKKYIFLRGGVWYKKDSMHASPLNFSLNILSSYLLSHNFQLHGVTFSYRILDTSHSTVTFFLTLKAKLDSPILGLFADYLSPYATYFFWTYWKLLRSVISWVFRFIDFKQMTLWY